MYTRYLPPGFVIAVHWLDVSMMGNCNSTEA